MGAKPIGHIRRSNIKRGQELEDLPLGEFFAGLRLDAFPSRQQQDEVAKFRAIIPLPHPPLTGSLPPPNAFLTGSTALVQPGHHFQVLQSIPKAEGRGFPRQESADLNECVFCSENYTDNPTRYKNRTESRALPDMTMIPGFEDSKVSEDGDLVCIPCYVRINADNPLSSPIERRYKYILIQFEFRSPRAKLVHAIGVQMRLLVANNSKTQGLFH